MCFPTSGNLGALASRAWQPGDAKTSPPYVTVSLLHLYLHLKPLGGP